MRSGVVASSPPTIDSVTDRKGGLVLTGTPGPQLGSFASGHPTADYLAVKVLTSAAALTVSGTSHTIYLAVDPDNFSPGTLLETNTARLWLYRDRAGAARVGYYTVTDQYEIIDVDYTEQILTYVLNAGANTGQIYKGNTLLVNGAFAGVTVTSAVLTVGNSALGAGSYRGKIGQVIWCAGVHDAATQTVFRNYLSSATGIAL